MKTIFLAFAVLMTVLGPVRVQAQSSPDGAAPPASRTLVLSNATVIDGTGAPPVRTEVLIIRGERIAYLGSAAGAPKVEDVAPSIDLTGHYVLPGLIDTHVHVARFPDTREHARRILQGALEGGVTTVRDMGGDARALADLNATVARGERLLPSVVSSAVIGGTTLFVDQRFDMMSAGFERGRAPWARGVTPQNDVVLTVAEARGAGVGGLKLYGNLDAAMIARLTREAHRQHMQVWAHATVFPATPQDLVGAGVDGLAHAAYLVWAGVDDVPADYGARIRAPWSTVPADHPDIRVLLEDMARRHVSLDATLYVFEKMNDFSPEVRAPWAAEAAAWGAKVVALAHKLGVPITTGTDWFEPGEGETLPHTHDEMAMLVNNAGLTPMDAIVAATRNGAAASGVLEDRGTVAVGKRADLLVLSANPLDDITHTRDIALVIKNGQRVSAASR